MSPAAQAKKHTCATCQKAFDTDTARKQHARAKHSQRNASQAVARARNLASSAPVGPLDHRGITYSALSATEQNDIQGRLSRLCHPEQRLVREGYSLPNSNNESRSTHRSDLPCPDADPSTPKTAAIVLDCEMAGTAGGQNEIVQMTLVDFLSGNILKSCLVNPSRPIINWRKNITGIDAVSMQEATARNEVVHGWEAARAELWRFADKDTILIGQSVYNDLQVLHTSHARIIDSAIITADAALGKNSTKRKRWGLEALCNELLDIQIRKPSQTGDRGVHDALEDALATREVVLLCVQKPDKLKCWARAARAAFFKGRSSERAPPQASGRRGSRYSGWNYVVEEEDEDEDEDEEPLRWGDVIDWETWPKSPPDSD